MAKIDLNLLRVFEAVLHRRSVSRAAVDLGVTASAVSHALTRLRLALEDDLFIARDTGMEPTIRALALAPGIRQGLAHLDEALDTAPFDPARTARTFRIAMTDYATTLLLPAVINRLSHAAPQINLRIFPFNRMDVMRQVEDGGLDCVIGWFGAVPDRMQRTTLLVDHEAIIVRRDHPLTKAPLTRASLFQFDHLVVELTGTTETTHDGFLTERGIARRVWIERLLLDHTPDDGAAARVAVCVPHYAAVPPILATSDLVATLPRRLAVLAQQSYPLALLDLPDDRFSAPLDLVTHRRSSRDAGLIWLTEILKEVGASGNAL